MPGPPALPPPADIEKGLHQLLQEGVGAHVAGEVVGRLRCAGRRCAPRAGRRRWSGRTCRRSRPRRGRGQRRLERLHQLGERTSLGLDGERCLDAVADGAGQLGQADREVARVVMTSRWRRVKAERQFSRQPRRRSRLPARQDVGKLLGDSIEVQRRVEVVPAEHLEGRQVVPGLRLREMGEAKSGVRRLRRRWK